jgi:hypothetical protein
LQNTVIFKEFKINTVSHTTAFKQQIIYSEADKVHILPKYTAVFCSVCNFQCYIIPSYTVTEKSGKPFKKKL